MSLYDFIKDNFYRGFSLNSVRHIAYQLIRSIACACLSSRTRISSLTHCMCTICTDCHSISLCHTDLKIENILLESNELKPLTNFVSPPAALFAKHFSHQSFTHVLQEQPPSISAVYGDKPIAEYREPKHCWVRLIDFGGGTFAADHHSRVICTRQYRGPEVLLGVGWSYPADMWSVGCIIAELYTGELLFNTHHNLEHLALMEAILEEPLPKQMITQSLAPHMDVLRQRHEYEVQHGVPPPRDRCRSSR